MEMLNVLGPVVLITLIGFLMGRSKIDLHAGTLSTTVILVATPALIFSTLTSIGVSIEMLLNMAASAFLSVTIAAVLGLIVVKVSGFSLRTYLPSLMFPNSGNMGLPLVLLAFGEEGLRLGVSYFFVIALLQHSVGFSIASGSYRIVYLLKQPLIYAVAGVVLVVSTGIEVPEVILTTTDILGGMMIPAMLIMLGNSLAGLSIADFRPAIIIACARLVIGVLSALIIIRLLSLEGPVAGTVFVMATMPTAIVTYVFAQRYRPDPGKIAGAVVASTLLTFLCLPVLLWGAGQLAIL
ncbi:AEC family transporter [Candidatus Halocynthiibacter alkanivorans]|uniref:AEC family transporter n=1 Tax=Candidatus Halocynthiibacter alkanivorans TaxID=2267619 RepID=UPI000DF38BD6|nr:AEC family transporter [Candidatus Halocynthiibacter alkanivorans]